MQTPFDTKDKSEVAKQPVELAFEQAQIFPVQFRCVRFSSYTSRAVAFMYFFFLNLSRCAHSTFPTKQHKSSGEVKWKSRTLKGPGSRLLLAKISF